MPRKKTSLLESICTLMTESLAPQRTLDAIVRLVAEYFDTEVCSVYIFDTQKTHLVLAATFGLNRESIGKIRMRIQEGLTGLVMERLSPVFVRNPAAHERFKYFEGSGEERYSTFLGLPLIYHQKSLGVMVIQTIAEAAIDERDIPVFSVIASQIAATVAYSGLLEDLKRQRDRADAPEMSSPPADGTVPLTFEAKPLLRGVPVSAGFAEGHAHYLFESIGFDQIKLDVSGKPSVEAHRLEQAFETARREFQELARNIRDMPEQDAAIFEASLMLLDDAVFKRKIRSHIETGYRAESALKRVVEAYVEHFYSFEDPYLKERAVEIEDVGKNILRCLLGIRTAAAKSFEGATIVIASDISAVELVRLRQANLKGILLARGGKTSHAAILAKASEIPMIVGLKEVLETIHANDFLIMDGTSGLVFREPPPDIRREYERLKQEKQKRFRQLDRLRDRKARTRDGRIYGLGANISLMSDLALVHKYGADHIGLYRTEFPFLVRKEFPSEEEQFSLYCRIIAGAEGKTVTFRTLDVGGDKFLPYLDYPKERNPYLGWRAVRFCLELDDVFRAQIRAVLRASSTGPAKLMFPMVTAVGEIRRISRILEEERTGLKARDIPFDDALPIGIMVEVPGTVKILRHIADLIDFVSIGTNDLIQYTLAVDRNNDKVAAMYTPLHPAVIATVAEIVSICKSAAKPIGICGEAASNPLCVILYLAMGVDQLSMNPASVPVVKNLIRRLTVVEAEEILARVLEMADENEISAFLTGVCEAKIGECPA